MPSLDLYRKINNKSIGNVFREQSDIIMERTWDSDIQSRVCYMYDYFHEDGAEKEKYVGIEHTEKTNKLKIDAKFIVTSSSSFNSERVEYHLMFKPSERFSTEDSNRKDNENLKLQEMKANAELYKYEFPIGLYIDIPDAKNVYRRWLIVDRNYEQQFVKYSILPCEKYYHWYDNGRCDMWGVSRSAVSNNGKITNGSVFTIPESKEQFILPFNEITKNITYDKRFILDEHWVKTPKAHKVTNFTNPHSYGVLKIDLEQVPFNADTDKLIDGYWYADYDATSDKTYEPALPILETCSLTCGNYSNINIGGTRTLTATFHNENNEEIEYSVSDKSNYSFTIIDGDIEVDATPFITVNKVNDDYKKIKIKYNSNSESNCYRACILKIVVTDDNNILFGTLQLKIS